jgi:hypothetical protein
MQQEQLWSIHQGVVAWIGWKSANLGQITEGCQFNAEQAQCPTPSPHPQDEVPGEELGGV